MSDTNVNGDNGEVSPIDYNALPDDPHFIPEAQRDDSLASPFLSKITDDNERKIVEKYVREWDAGVTKKVMGIHDQYRPYKELGADIDQIRLAMNIMQTLDSNPQQVWQILNEQYGQAQQPGNGVPGVPELDEDDPYSGLHPVVAQELKQMREIVQLMAGQQIQQREVQTQGQEDQMLEQHLANLHQQHGDFDEDFVMTKVLAGRSWESALEEYNGLMQRLTGTVRRAPSVLGGGGAIPANKIPPSKLGTEDLNKFVADQLAALHRD
jgi:hypothetical protein